MSVILVRIDDRLVHGQVVEGWLRSLHISHVVVASDSVAEDETQSALYMLAVPHGVDLTCARVVQVASSWLNGAWDKERVLVLVASPEDVLRLVEAGAPMKTVNVGGLHFREGRVQVLKAVSLDEHDVNALKRLAERGIALEARPLPLDEPVDVGACLDRWRQERHLMGDQPR
jgi:mannose/fructose/N-acetylgalactosamine-specific phosphotransferase system component IIB